MSTLTSRFGLYKPATSENYNVITDQNNNWDALDAALGLVPVTSGTRPASTVNGLMIRETDTDRAYYHLGTTPASAGWRQLMGVNHTLVASASTGLIYRSRLATSDTQDRLSIDVSGKMSWGTGAAVADVTLARTGSASATLTGALTVTSGMAHDGGRPLPFAEAAGTITITVTAATTGATAVTFPPGRFTVTPIVTVGLLDPASGSAKLIPRVTSPTSTGFTATVYTGDLSTTTSTVTLHWHAKQMLSGSAAG